MENIPCMAQLVGALLACLPSSGGLECDFGLLKDVIKAKRASLGQGYVEVEMMLKLNKHLFFSSPSKVVKLPDDKWMDCIPKQPCDSYECDEDFKDASSSGEGDLIINNEQDAAPIITITSNSDNEAEAEAYKDEEGASETSGETEFNADEYSDIYEATLASVTDSQLSTYTVFDPDETQM